jgi:hypothetical protein
MAMFEICEFPHAFIAKSAYTTGADQGCINPGRQAAIDAAPCMGVPNIGEL